MLDAHRSRTRIVALPRQSRPSSPYDAYAIQDIVAQALGPVGGWKVGAADLHAEPQCAPILNENIFSSPASVPTLNFPLRGLEVELAFSMGEDMPPRHRPYSREDVRNAVASVFPAIEIVESRYQDDAAIDPLSKLADNSSHGALVCGVPQPLTAPPGLGSVHALLFVDDELVVQTENGNRAGDLFRLMEWLVNHLSARGCGLKAGQIITTGSYTGLEFAGPHSHVRGVIEGMGDIELSFK